LAGVKHDHGKIRIDLAPVEALLSMARAFTYGADKYSDRNWEGGLEWGRLYASCLRHLFAFWDGEEKDEESGLHPLDHALAALAMLCTSYQRKIGKDTRSNTEQKCLLDYVEKHFEEYFCDH